MNDGCCAELDEANVDGYYILACSYAARNNYEAAYQQLCLLFTHAENSSEQREHVARLNGLVCTKLKPPKYLEALESFDYLVETYPEDMNSVSVPDCRLHFTLRSALRPVVYLFSVTLQTAYINCALIVTYHSISM
jgi:hypothetical protein